MQSNYPNLCHSVRIPGYQEMSCPGIPATIMHSNFLCSTHRMFHSQDYKSSHCCNQLASQWHRSTPHMLPFSVVTDTPRRPNTKVWFCHTNITQSDLTVRFKLENLRYWEYWEYSNSSCNSIWTGCCIGILHISKIVYSKAETLLCRLKSV